MIAHSKLPTASLLAILLLSIFLVGMHPAVAQSTEGNSDLQAANTALGQAFTAVLNAEKAGANVTDLVARINDAANILAEAENNYRTGQPIIAETQAENVIEPCTPVNYLGSKRPTNRHRIEPKFFLANDSIHSDRRFHISFGFVLNLAMAKRKLCEKPIQN